MTERRSAKRYKLALSLTVDLLAPLRTEWQKGTTQDISVRGIYFLVDREPAVDTPLELKIAVPSKATADAEVFIQARGKVVRVERFEERPMRRVGVAAALEACDIVSTRLPSA